MVFLVFASQGGGGGGVASENKVMTDLKFNFVPVIVRIISVIMQNLKLSAFLFFEISPSSIREHVIVIRHLSPRIDQTLKENHLLCLKTSFLALNYNSVCISSKTKNFICSNFSGNFSFRKQLR